jgi:hypothetical protein
MVAKDASYSPLEYAGEQHLFRMQQQHRVTATYYPKVK